MDYRLDHQPEPLKQKGWVPVFWVGFCKGSVWQDLPPFRLDGVVCESRDEAIEHSREGFRRWLGLHDLEGRYEETE